MFSYALSEREAGSDAAAMKTLTRPSRRFPDKPLYRHWRDFEITNVHFTVPRRVRRRVCETAPSRA